MPKFPMNDESMSAKPGDVVDPEEVASSTSHDESVNNEEDTGSSSYTFERLVDEPELDAIAEDDDEHDDADGESGEEGQEEEVALEEDASGGGAVVEFDDGTVVDLTREEIDRIVNAGLRPMEEDYAATSRAGQRNEIVDEFAIKSPILAAALAKRPDLQEKIRALKAMKQQMMSGQSFVEAPPAEEDDFPDDYDELQLQDAEAIREANRTASEPFRFPDNVMDPFDDWADFKTAPESTVATSKQDKTRAQDSSQDTDLGFSDAADIKFDVTTNENKDHQEIDDFDPFPTPSETPVIDASTVAEPSHAPSVPHVPSDTYKGPPVRAVSPLNAQVRDDIADAMSRIQLNPRNISPWTERLFDVALQTGRRAIDAHKATQEEPEPSSE